MTDYGNNFDPIGQKGAFQSEIHKMFALLHSKSQKDFKTFQEYDDWCHSVFQKFSSAFNLAHRQQYIDSRSKVNVSS